MCEMLIEKAMVIDDVEYVRNELEILTGKKIEDMEVVRRFICSEKNTKLRFLLIKDNFNKKCGEGTIR